MSDGRSGNAAPEREQTAAIPLRLRVLGQLDLRDASGQALEAVLAQPKRLALLIYLSAALPRGFHQRDVLLAMFWPEHDAEHASGALRQALHFLRRQLPPEVIQTRGAEQVGLSPGSVACDAVRFDEALDHGREEEALEHYAGELLPGFHVAGAPDFERWLALERERLRRRAARAALVLARRAAEQRHAEVAAHWTELAEQIAPESEHAASAAGSAPVPFTRSDPPLSPSVSNAPATAEFVFRHPRLRTGTTGSSRNLEALHAYLRGRSSSRKRTGPSMLDAIRQYHRALQLQPDLAEAHVGLAEAWLVLPVYSAYAAADAFPQAKHHASKALALDPTLAAAHAWLAHATVCYEWDWTAARASFERALDLDPASADVRTSYALYYLTPTGQFEEAIHSIEIARDLDPTSPTVNAYVAMTCYYARRYERAVGEAKLALELGETLPLAWWTLGMAQEQAGELSAAIRSFERAVELTHGSSLMLAQLARARARVGDRAEAEAHLATILARAEELGPAPFFMATVFSALGDSGTALEWLERAYRERNPTVVFLGVFPVLDALRSERRFGELLVRIGLGSGR